MIQRLNFIEREPFQITYFILLAVFCATITLCFFIYATGWLGQIQAETHIALLQKDIGRLKMEREKLMNQGEATKGTGPFAEIYNTLQKEPPWFSILGSLSASLPPNVWIVSFKSFDKAAPLSTKGALVNGLAKQPQPLAFFLNALEQSIYFENIVLTSSKEEGGLFNFSLSCDISPSLPK